MCQQGHGSSAIGFVRRTTEKCRRSRVAMASASSRSAIANTEASTAPSGKSLYFSDQLDHAVEVLASKRDQADLSCADGAQERGFGTGALLAFEHEADFGQDRIGHEERLGRTPHECDAAGVVLVVAVGGCDQRPGVPDDHSGSSPSSARRISAERAARSPLPLANAPTKSGNGHSSPPPAAGALSRTRARIGATCDSGRRSIRLCNSSRRVLTWPGYDRHAAHHRDPQGRELNDVPQFRHGNGIFRGLASPVGPTGAEKASRGGRWRQSRSWS